MSWQRKLLCNLDGVTFYTYPDNWDSKLEYWLQKDEYLWVCKDYSLEITVMLRKFNDYMDRLKDWQPTHMLPFPEIGNLKDSYVMTRGVSDYAYHIANDKHTIIVNLNLLGLERRVFQELWNDGRYHEVMFNEMLDVLYSYERGVKE